MLTHTGGGETQIGDSSEGVFGSKGTADVRRLTPEDPREALRAASERRNLAALQQALAKARKVKVDRRMISNAEELLKVLDLEDFLRAGMVEAEATGNSTLLRAAIARARASPRQSAEIDLQAPQQFLLKVEAQNAVETLLHRRRCDMHALRDAFEKASMYDVKGPAIEQALTRLAQQEATAQSTRPGSSPTGFVTSSPTGLVTPESPSYAENMLWCAIHLQETGALRQAIRRAEAMPLTLRDTVPGLKEAKHVLIQIESHRALANACKRKIPNTDALKDAISRAESCELRCDELEQARALLAESQGSSRPASRSKTGSRPRFHTAP